MGPPASSSLLPMRGQGRACDAMVVSSQNDVDAAFADMEHLLLAERPAVARSGGVCADCGCREFVYAGSGTPHPGSRICTACGVVQGGNVYFETMYGSYVPTSGSNYKRIHHFHERISQLLLLESQIPDREMLLIAEKLCDGTVDTLNKDTIRAVLRSRQPACNRAAPSTRHPTGASGCRAARPARRSTRCTRRTGCCAPRPRAPCPPRRQCRQK
mmetsp:Transcript_21906/g.64647  ORF Transcript_21906/g.64647 Transcript_21906/m.64647 type:complete len:215 (+) Transcript_21906:83-727(+)